MKKHGAEKRRTWRKLHLAVDVDTHEAVSAQVSLVNVGDNVPKSKACFIPVQHFDFIALFVGEQEQCAAAQGQVGVIFDNRSEAVDGLSKIDAFAIEIDFGSTEHTFHDSAPISSAR